MGTVRQGTLCPRTVYRKRTLLSDLSPDISIGSGQFPPLTPNLTCVCAMMNHELQGKVVVKRGPELER